MNSKQMNSVKNIDFSLVFFINFYRKMHCIYKMIVGKIFIILKFFKSFESNLKQIKIRCHSIIIEFDYKFRNFKSLFHLNAFKFWLITQKICPKECSLCWNYGTSQAILAPFSCSSYRKLQNSIPITAGQCLQFLGDQDFDHFGCIFIG